jgi:hypothetical protein
VLLTTLLARAHADDAPPLVAAARPGMAAAPL